MTSIKLTGKQELNALICVRWREPSRYHQPRARAARTGGKHSQGGMGRQTTTLL